MSEKDTDILPKTLIEIVAQTGVDIIGQQRLIGYVGDFLGGDYPFKRVLRLAVQSGVGEKVLNMSRTGEVSDMELQNVIYNFQEESFLRPAAATYIVQCLALACGIIEDVDEYTDQEKSEGSEPQFASVDDGEFCGYTDSEGQRSGFGILKREDMSYYAGEWRLGMQMGMGLGFSTSREKYAGQWRFNTQHGVGTAILENGTIYSGQWSNGRMHGRGSLYFPNGEMVTARFEDGQMVNGMGTWVLKDGSEVIGFITKSGPLGECQHIMPDGEIIVENWPL